MSVCSDRNASFKFILISRNEAKHLNLFVLTLGGALPSQPTKELRGLLVFILQIFELIYCTYCLSQFLQ
jgi:hypothetical protein